ncbi:glycosyltransferase family 1 protein [Peribacillus simplex]|uniref:glycosyltransferase family 1 protein n=1 Tax=Peribacillus simplex TaxID=1478 RepID=UPI00298DE4DA|nr:glycosyltransferase family 1 protein [Peribacillus simplex]MDW7613460.1 glycosyltransferase family 1 protein [Peribacillus simplex]
MEPIRILQVIGSLNNGGSQAMIMSIYENIDRSKIQFDFVIDRPNELAYGKRIEELGGKIYFMPQFTAKNIFAFQRAWHNFFSKHPEYKIVHGHVRSTASIYLRIAKKYGLTTVAHSHSTSSGSGLSAMIKNILQYPIRYTADKFFACSISAGEWLFGKRKCNNESFFILNNAIDAKKFIFKEEVRINKRKEFQIEDKFVIGHIGRFDTPKNHEFLIDIFKEVHNKNKNSVLILVGDGELRPTIEKKVNDLDLTDFVIFTGIRSDIPEILQGMDIFVFPSLFEGLGIVAIEAQAAGLPCIVSDSIPKEAFITSLIQSLPLNSSLDEWKEHILYYSNAYRRRNMKDEISSAGFDINGTTQWLQNFYLGNCGEYEHRNR